MYLKRVVLDSIRGFRVADLDFCPDGENYAGWAVVTGDNGSGKTALLKAIALAILGPSQSRVLLPDLTGWVTSGQVRGTISVEIKPAHEVDGTHRGGYPVRGTFWAEVQIVKSDGSWTMNPDDIFRHKKLGASNGPWQPGTPGWFALGYGPFRRLYGSSPDAQRLMVLPGRTPRFTTLFREDATLAEAEEWIKDLNYKALEKRASEKAVMESLLALLADEFLKNDVRVQRVDSDGLWLTDSAGHTLPLAQLSEGFRSAIAMLADIFRHMVAVYGNQIIANDSADQHPYVDRPGVVLIDEIDAHLHPSWQREIGEWLRRHFPKVQFIVATHSPIVAQAADGGRIYHLPQPGAGDPFVLSRSDYQQIIAGRPTEILLTPAFGLRNTRSPQAVRARKRHAVLVAKDASTNGLTPDERQELEQLELFVRDGAA